MRAVFPADKHSPV